MADLRGPLSESINNFFFFFLRGAAWFVPTTVTLEKTVRACTVVEDCVPNVQTIVLLGLDGIGLAHICPSSVLLARGHPTTLNLSVSSVGRSSPPRGRRDLAFPQFLGYDIITLRTYFSAGL